MRQLVKGRMLSWVFRENYGVFKKFDLVSIGNFYPESRVPTYFIDTKEEFEILKEAVQIEYGIDYSWELDFIYNIRNSTVKRFPYRTFPNFNKIRKNFIIPTPANENDLTNQMPLFWFNNEQRLYFSRRCLFLGIGSWVLSFSIKYGWRAIQHHNYQFRKELYRGFIREYQPQYSYLLPYFRRNLYKKVKNIKGKWRSFPPSKRWTPPKDVQQFASKALENNCFINDMRHVVPADKRDNVKMYWAKFDDLAWMNVAFFNPRYLVTPNRYFTTGDKMTLEKLLRETFFKIVNIKLLQKYKLTEDNHALIINDNLNDKIITQLNLIVVDYFTSFLRYAKPKFNIDDERILLPKISRMSACENTFINRNKPKWLKGPQDVVDHHFVISCQNYFIKTYPANPNWSLLDRRSNYRNKFIEDREG